MKIYGIKSCGSVKKALSFLESRKIPYEFIDLKLFHPTRPDIERWLKSLTISKIFNSQSATYRNLGLKELALDEEGKIEWLTKEPLLIKRPIIELGSGEVMVGFDLKEYESRFDD